MACCENMKIIVSFHCVKELVQARPFDNIWKMPCVSIDFKLSDLLTIFLKTEKKEILRRLEL